jgi:hypothetical protein
MFTIVLACTIATNESPPNRTRFFTNPSFTYPAFVVERSQRAGSERNLNIFGLSKELRVLHPSTEETELHCLDRTSTMLKRTGQHADLREAPTCIIEFESCYQIAILTLEGLLWLCRHHAAAAVTLSELNGDRVLQQLRQRFPNQVRRLPEILDSGTETAFRQELEHLSDARRFLEKASAAVFSMESLTEDAGKCRGLNATVLALISP